MGMYGVDALNRINENFSEVESVTEMLLISELSKMPSDKLKIWCESDEAKALVEANVLKKPTLMRLSKADDEKRRIKLAAYSLAKAANDPLWDKLVKNREQRKQIIEKIMTKYGNKAERIAKISQKDYIKNYGKAVPEDSK